MPRPARGPEDGSARAEAGTRVHAASGGSHLTSTVMGVPISCEATGRPRGKRLPGGGSTRVWIVIAKGEPDG